MEAPCVPPPYEELSELEKLQEEIEELKLKNTSLQAQCHSLINDKLMLKSRSNLS